uniref:Uncharacterized protein n=1 Tax=viral metagenome TaxID=1070528 RepID=A0A6H2A4H5_9ZZZZ
MTNSNWEKRFDEMFGGGVECNVYKGETIWELDVTDEVKQFISQVEAEAREEGYKEGVKMLEWRINCNTLISELYGWKSIVDQTVDECLEKWIDKKDQRKFLTKSLSTPTKEQNV